MKLNPIEVRFVASSLVASCLFFLGTTEIVSAQNGKAFDVRQVEESGGLVLAVRPKRITALDGFTPFTALIGARMEEQYGFKLEQIQQFIFHGVDTNEPFGFRLAIKLDTDLNGAQYLKGLAHSREVETIEFRGESYLKAPVPDWVPRQKEFRRQQTGEKEGADKAEVDKEEGDEELANFLCLWRYDDTSAIVAREDVIKKLISKEKPEQVLLKGKAWDQVKTQTVAVTFDATILGAFVKDIGQGDGPGIADLKELAENMETGSLGIRAGDTSQLVGYLYCQSPTHSRKAKEAIDKLVDLSKSLIKLQIASFGNRQSPEIGMMELANSVLDNVKVTRNGNLVKLQATVDTTEFLDSSMDAVADAKQAAFRTQSMNNGKQLGLAFHNYFSTYRKFPAAVLTGPKGHKYSWRVEMLPYIEQQALYDQYNFEEDWDSANNLKVLEQMPQVFRNPISDKNSTDTSYLAFVGPDTLFWKDGAAFSDVRDGTSNTIMYVESKKSVPWTKPEDIAYDPFDPEKLAPTLGGYYDGGFNAVFADGSVRFIKNDIDEAELHSMIQMNDQADAAK